MIDCGSILEANQKQGYEKSHLQGSVLNFLVHSFGSFSRSSLLVCGSGSQELVRALMHRMSHIRVVSATAADLVASPGLKKGKMFFFSLFWTLISVLAAASPEHAVSALFAEIGRAVSLGPLAV